MHAHPCSHACMLYHLRSVCIAGYPFGWHRQRRCAPCCRLIWALVHCNTRTHQQRGLDLAQAALDNDQRSQDQDRELRYYLAGVQLVLSADMHSNTTSCSCSSLHIAAAWSPEFYRITASQKLTQADKFRRPSPVCSSVCHHVSRLVVVGGWKPNISLLAATVAPFRTCHKHGQYSHHLRAATVTTQSNYSLSLGLGFYYNKH